MISGALLFIEGLGGPATFSLYAAVCVGLALFTARFIPETKGRTLERIETDLRGTTA